MMETKTMAEALAALYALAPRCDVCEEHVATRAGATAKSAGYRTCDRADCTDHIRCLKCNATDAVVALDGWYCAWCGGKEPVRETRAAWRDLKYAAALRAANAAHEALS